MYTAQKRHIFNEQVHELSSQPEKEQYDAQVDRIARGAGISFVGQGLGRVLSYGIQVALAWMYGPTQLGLYVLGTTLVELTNILAQFGMDNGVVRYVAHYRAQKDVSRVRGTILLALAAPLALSLIIASLIFFGAGFLANEVFSKPPLEPIFMVFSVSLPFYTVMNMALYATVGFRTVKYLVYVQQVLQPLINLSLLIGIYLLGGQILEAVVAYVASMLVGSLAAIYCLRRTFPRLLVDLGSSTKFEFRTLFNHSWPLIISNVTQRINGWTSITVLGIFATASAVGIYNAAARTAVLSALVLFAFNGIFSPIIASLYGEGRLEDLSGLYQDVSRWVFTGASAIFLITVVLGRDILAVLGSEFVSGWVVLIIIAGAQLFNSSVGPTQRMLAMTRHQKVLMFATAGSALVGVAANVALVPLYGVLGAAGATAIAIILMNTITLLSVRRLLDVWPYSRRYMKPISAGVLAAAVTYVLRLVFPLSSPILSMLVFATLFLVVFAAILLALGLSPSDRQFLASFWMMLRRRPITRLRR